jgi:hypothetical protein
MQNSAKTLTIEEELDDRIEEEAGQQVGIIIRLSMDMRPQE